MNLRKFYFTISFILLAFLFVCGAYLLKVIASGNAENSAIPGIKSVLSEYFINNEPINILIMGEYKSSGNTDTMLLVNYNPATTKTSILSIPRDTKVQIENINRKINFAYPYGEAHKKKYQGGGELAVKTVSELLGVKIKYYIHINTVVFKNVVDILGGVKNFYVPVDLNYDDSTPGQDLHIHLTKGYHDMDGDMAEQFMRYRHPQNGKYTKELMQYYDGSDIKRIEAQQRFIKELMRQKTSIKYITRFKDILFEIFDQLETNMTTDEILKMAVNLPDFKASEINFFTLPGKNGEGSPWYYLMNDEETAQLVEQYFSAESGFAGTGNIDTHKPSKDNSDETDNEKSSKPKKPTTKKNPSNSESSVKGTTKPQP